MDIHILRNGEQTGPYTEDTVQELLKRGSVLIDDLAWRPGMEEWIPLMRLLYPAAVPAEAEVAAEPEPDSTPETEPTPEIEDPSPGAVREPATKRQKAFLTYMGIAFPPEITREDASMLTNDSLENPRDPGRIARWNEERLRLHPELFAAEIQTRKENRAQRFFEICEQEGAACFDKVTKAHCQVLVGHLDVSFPNWDANEREAVWKYFFPALAEKFPQLVTEEGKEKLQHLEGGRAPDQHLSHSPGSARSRPSSAVRKLMAVVRGIVIGFAILGVLWVGERQFDKKRPPASRAGGERPSTSASDGVKPAAEAGEAAKKESTPDPDAAKDSPKSDAPATPAASPEPGGMNAKPPPGSGDELPTKSSDSASASLSELIPPSPARDMVILTKPVPATMAYGKVVIPPGTPVAIVQKSGSLLTVRYLDKTVTVPTSSTDLGTDPAPESAAMVQ